MIFPGEVDAYPWTSPCLDLSHLHLLPFYSFEKPLRHPRELSPVASASPLQSVRFVNPPQNTTPSTHLRYTATRYSFIKCMPSPVYQDGTTDTHAEKRPPRTQRYLSLTGIRGFEGAHKGGISSSFPSSSRGAGGCQSNGKKRFSAIAVEVGYSQSPHACLWLQDIAGKVRTVALVDFISVLYSLLEYDFLSAIPMGSACLLKYKQNIQ